MEWLQVALDEAFPLDPFLFGAIQCTLLVFDLRKVRTVLLPRRGSYAQLEVTDVVGKVV